MLTLTLEGLQHGCVSGAQPRGVATQNPLQVVGGIAEEQIRCAIACWAEQAEALGGVAKHILQESVWQDLMYEGMHGCALVCSVYMCVCLSGLCVCTYSQGISTRCVSHPVSHTHTHIHRWCNFSSRYRPVNVPSTSRHDTCPPCAPPQRLRGRLPGGIAHTRPGPPQFRLGTAASGPPAPGPGPRTPGSYLSRTGVKVCQIWIEVLI